VTGEDMTDEAASHAAAPDEAASPDAAPVAGYPERWSADVVLRDGGTVHVRPILPSDGDGIRALHGRLSAETIYFRFFSPLTTLSPKMLDRFVRVDYFDRFALVALLGEDIIAVGRYERLPSQGAVGDEAEVAFLVDDAHQGRGLATMLLEYLVARAEEVGITRFVADTLPENVRMLRVFHEAGFDDQRTFGDGVIRVAFPIRPTEASVAASHDRERHAAARSVRRILAPRNVAVIGASRRIGSLGNELLRNLLLGHFNGPVYPVNSDAVHVNSVRAYPSIHDVPDRVDLAVIVVPAEGVPAVVEQCARKHVGGLVVISSGFAERDAAGLLAESRMVSEARRNGMRMIGPNCMGIINTDPAVGLNATFSPMPPRGRIGFIAQSGGLGVVILDEVARRGLGVSTFVSAGNKADVSGNDMLQYWDEDPATDVVLMYIETFGNPRTFARVARRVSRTKPIVAVKSGRSAAGSRAAGWNRQERQSDASVDALFRHSGVIRTETLEELFDVAQVLASQPRPAGRRVAIVGNNGGPGVLAADACSAAGLVVAPLGEETQRKLSASLPWQGSVRNPVDLAPDARPEAFRLAIDTVLADPGVDAVIALYTSPLAARADDVAGALANAPAGGWPKPVLACILGRRGLLPIPSPDGVQRSIPSFAFPEAAARALGRVAEYAEWRSRPEGKMPAFADIDRNGARAVVAAWSSAPPDDGWLGPDPTRRLLAAYGVGRPPEATDPEPGEAGDGDGDGDGDGGDLQVDVSQDPLFGPLVALRLPGRGGRGPRHEAFRALPITDTDATELRVDVLAGQTPDGRPLSGLDAAGIDDVLQRVGRLVEDIPELAEMEIGLHLDHPTPAVRRARIRLSPWEPRPELALRRLR
jgi:acyl-CoA synthetase (NDP forming)/RimJ/RimL family protein N-acetyltransferase